MGMFGLSKSERTAKEAGSWTAHYFGNVLDSDLLKDVAKKEPLCSPAGVAVLTRVLLVHGFLGMGFSYDTLHDYLKNIEAAKHWTNRAMREGDMDSYDFMKISTALEIFSRVLSNELNLRKDEIGESNHLKMIELISSPPNPFDDECLKDAKTTKTKEVRAIDFN